MAHSFRNSRSRQSLCLGSHLLADRLVLGAGLEGSCSELFGLAAEKPENFRGLVLVINEAPFTGDVTWPVVVSLAWTVAFFFGVAAVLEDRSAMCWLICSFSLSSSSSQPSSSVRSSIFFCGGPRPLQFLKHALNVVPLFHITPRL